jgi:hypothetical protein
VHHVYLPTSSEKVINLNDLPNIDSNPNLVPYPPTERLKKSYDHTQKFHLKWVAKLSWVEGVLIDDGKLNMVKCKVHSTIDWKPCLLAPKWDTLMKHEGRWKAKKDFPKLKIMKGDWYNNKTYRHKKSQTLYSTQVLLLSCSKSTKTITWS